MKKFHVFIILILVGILFGPQHGLAAEPAMATYTHYPIFQVNAVQPNILIMLDNSGSMNFNAYGSWPGNGGLVADEPFLGEPTRPRIQTAVSQASDDAEERLDGTVYDSTDLDMSTNITVGIRFPNVNIPRGSTITKVYITFNVAVSADRNCANDATEPTSLDFYGEKSDDAPAFDFLRVNDITLRQPTDASVPWNNIGAWVDGQSYQSEDLSPIVQEIVSRPGWSSGNAISFKITGSGCREAAAYPTNGPSLYVEYTPPQWTRYYGYFNPDYFYYESSNVYYHKYKKVRYVGDPGGAGYWEVTDLNGNALNLTDAMIDTENLWDGNWMNWVSMRRIDVLRKVLMGGLATARTGGGNQVNYGETPAQSDRTFVKRFDSSGGAAVSPYDGDYYYGMSGGDIYVDDDADPFLDTIAQVNLRIQKNVAYEPEDFHSYDSGDNVAGVLQKVGSKARWGNMWFNDGTGNNESGGSVVSPIGTNMVSMVTDLQNTGCDTWTPLGEAYYVAVQYFKQEDPAAGLDYPNGAVPNSNLGDDPYYNGGYVYCADSFVILLTDGASTMDSLIPASLKDYDGDGDDTTCDESTGVGCDYPTSGSDFLDDIALYARTVDLRSPTVGKTSLEGDQNVILYTIYAFGNDPNAENLLRDASKNGGFEDRDGNNLPNLNVEWDEDGDGDPDTFYKANDGYQLEAKLIEAINDILARAAAGTAVSVLATTGEGEGHMVQAYFRPVVPVGTEEVNWVGYLQSLWVDSHGNLREDTVQDQTLNVAEDKVVSYYLDSGTGDTRIKRFDVSAGTPFPDTTTAPFEELNLEQIDPIWEAGSRLAARDPNDRMIFTYVDKDKDGAVDEGTYNSFDDTGEVVRFHAASAGQIKPYLGVEDQGTWSYLGATHDDRVSNVISYIRGTDIAGLRSRTINGEVWKLGDIVYSTPVSISGPFENYHLIYADESYRDYRVANKTRETVVYVGANDGMLHAFTSWQVDPATGTYTKPAGAPAGEQIGEELWAYIPQSLLPHLKWLPTPDYTHVDYVDLKPKLFEAKIDHDNDGDLEWRVILVAGLNMGGKHIWAEGDFDDGTGALVSETRDFYPSYVCMDVTDPRNPRLLWERSYGDLELTTSYPAAIKVQDQWFVVFGSGPTDYDGTSTKDGHIFVVDLLTGAPYRNGGNDWLFETNEAKAFMGTAVSLDKNLNFSVDSIYIGETYMSATWQGKLYRIGVPAIDGLGNYDDTDAAHYVTDPLDASDPWVLSTLCNATRPVTAPPALSVDNYDNCWVYFGTGRYLSTTDKTTADANYLFGLKDPFFNKDHTPAGLYGTDYYHNYSTSLELTTADLFDADPYVVVHGGAAVYLDDDSYYGSFTTLLTAARQENGWIKTLETAGERILTKPSVLGGVVFTPSFLPNNDVCGYGGQSYLYGQYYETGTAYPFPVFYVNGIRTVNIAGDNKEEVMYRTSLGEGKASAVGVHVGTEGAQALIQQSTGTIVSEVLNPALNIRSGLQSWIDQ